MDRLNSDKSGLKRLWRETVCQSQLGRGCDGLVKGWVGSLPPGDNGPGDYPWIGPKFWIILIIDRFLEIGPSMVWLWGGQGRSGCDSVEILRWNVREVIVITTITTIHENRTNQTMTRWFELKCDKWRGPFLSVGFDNNDSNLEPLRNFWHCCCWERERMLLSSPKIFTESQCARSRDLKKKNIHHHLTKVKKGKGWRWTSLISHTIWSEQRWLF